MTDIFGLLRCLRIGDYHLTKVKDAVGGREPSELKAFSVKLAPPQLENVETALGMCGTESGNPEAGDNPTALR